MQRDELPAPGTPLDADPRLLAFWARLAERPERHDFCQTLRRVEALTPQLPRLGEAVRPADEPLRLSQAPELDFAPAALKALQREGPRPRLQQRLFGLLGPNGPLPLHLSALTHERLLHHGDATLQRFLDLLTHRFALLFYRAWAQAQPALGLDRAGGDDFAHRLGALFGIGLPALRERDATGDSAKLWFSGRLARQVRDADGLLHWCRAVFDLPVRVQPWCGHWMALAREQRTRLNGGARAAAQAQAQAQTLGRGAVLGATVWDVQHKFRLVIGPLPLARFQALLPGGPELARLQAMVRQWLGLEFHWDLQLVLARAEVPRLRLGRGGALGRSAWLGHWRHAHDAGNLVLDVEHSLSQARRHRRETRTSP